MTYYPFTLLLSASVPSDKRDKRFTKIKNAQIQIEEAVIGLSRNIFQAGGKIVFGGHPSISPLVALVATEYSVRPPDLIFVNQMIVNRLVQTKMSDICTKSDYATSITHFS